MNWIKEHIKLLMIMIVIAVLVTIIIVSSYTGGTAVEKGVQSASAAVAEPVSAAGSSISSFFSGLVHFRDIQRENYELGQENEALREELAQARLTRYELDQLRSLSNELNYSEYDDTYNRVSARVISVDSADMFDIFNINAGSSDGIKTDDIVINQYGLVGRVMSAGSGWAKVMALVDSSNSVSFTIARDPEITGIISGNGSGTLSGYVFDETRSVVEGDTLITSGIGYYPAGIEIGKVSSVNLDSGTRRKTVEAESSVDFNAVRYVTVLTK